MGTSLPVTSAFRNNALCHSPDRCSLYPVALAGSSGTGVRTGNRELDCGNVQERIGRYGGLTRLGREERYIRFCYSCASQPGRGFDGPCRRSWTLCLGTERCKSSV